MTAQPQTLFDIAGIQARIFTLPGRPPFMLAADLAEVYGTSVKALNQAVDRNPERFPEDFMFVLNEGDLETLRSQSVTANAISSKVRYAPNVYTHIGAYALSGVLKTPTAAQMSVVVHRAYAATEARALEEAQAMLVKFRSDASMVKRIRLQAMNGANAGLTFDAIWRMGNYSKPKLADALRECLALGLIKRLPKGMPMMQADLFGEV